MIKLADLIGAPFKAHGRSIKEGFDCYGLAIEVEKRAGRKLNDVFYSRVETAEQKRVQGIVLGGLNSLEKIDAPEQYCFIVINGMKRPHCAIYLGHDQMIHATEDMGVVIDRLSRWKFKVDGFYRVEKL